MFKIKMLMLFPFVDGLSGSVSMRWIHHLFGSFGEVVDVFVSRKIRRGTSASFAFVCFRWFEEAQKAIMEMNGKVLECQQQGLEDEVIV